MSIKKALIISLAIGLLAPFIAQAQIKISEIMYDPAGPDTKREWVEVFNSGTTSVDLTSYFLFENNVYHKLMAQSGNMLPAGEYAIIADSIPEVLADYPNYAGLVFDSTFSLGNSGESISVANAQKVQIDTYAYSSGMGAANDGNSLQITNGNTVSAGPTFGLINKTESEVPEPATSTATSTSGSGSSSSDGTSSHSQQEPVSSYVPTAAFKLGAGRDRTVLINTPIKFEAQISKPEARPSLHWNFGDLETDNGREVAHTYEYPGTYQVVLEGKNSAQTAISRAEVTVLRPELRVEQSTSTVSITNLLAKEINLGTFRLIYPAGSRRIPDNTLIKGGDTITFRRRPEEIVTAIEYPNGAEVLKIQPQSAFIEILAGHCDQETLPLVCKDKKLKSFLVQ